MKCLLSGRAKTGAFNERLNPICPVLFDLTPVSRKKQLSGRIDKEAYSTHFIALNVAFFERTFLARAMVVKSAKWPFEAAGNKRFMITRLGQSILCLQSCNHLEWNNCNKKVVEKIYGKRGYLQNKFKVQVVVKFAIKIGQRHFCGVSNWKMRVWNCAAFGCANELPRLQTVHKSHKSVISAGNLRSLSTRINTKWH